MTANDLIKFWQKSAAKDLKVAEDNLKLGHHNWALFFFQLVLEKTFKGLVVKNKGRNPLPTHDLVKLAGEAGIELNLEQKQDLKEVTTFNIEARYDDVKFSFYKKATKEYTKIWSEKCRRYYQWLRKM